MAHRIPQTRLDARILRCLTALATTLIFALATAPAHAQLFEGDIKGGNAYHLMGSISLFTAVQARVDDENPDEVSTAVGLRAYLAAAVAELPLGGNYGFEIHGHIAWPFTGYVSGFLVGGGVYVEPFRVGPLAPGLGLGIAVGSDLHAYLHPRLGLALGENLGLSVGYYWVHPRMSRDWGDSGLQLPGVGYNRLHADIAWLNGYEGQHDRRGVHVFVDRHEFSGQDDMLLANGAARGVFWGGGIGFAF